MTRSTKLRGVLLAATSSLLLVPGIAFASDESDDTATQSAQEAERESVPGEIVVTALKRTTTLQETPMSISALSGDLLQKQGVQNFPDLIRSFPGLNVTEDQPGQRRLSIRGVQGAGENTVGLYYGETPVTGPTSATSDPSLMSPDLNLFDTNRVEVLRGPQGTLYGAGSVGGTMRIIFNEPDATDFQGKIDLGMSAVKGGTTGYEARGMINVPLIADTLAVRVAAYHVGRPGFVDNVRLNQQNVNTGRASGGRLMLRFTPTTNLTISASAHVQEETIDNTNGWFPSIGRYKSDLEEVVPFNSNFKLFNGTVNWDMGFAQLTGSTSFYRWRAVRTYDQTRNGYSYASTGRFCTNYFQVASCSAAQRTQYAQVVSGLLPLLGYQPLGLDTYTSEVRLSSPGSGPLNWTIGFFYEKRDDFASSEIYLANARSGLAIEPRTITSRNRINVDSKQTAFFGEASYRFFDTLTFTAGARRYHYDKSTRNEIDCSVSNRALNAACTGGARISPADASGWVSKFNLSYEPNRDLLLYVQRAEGFRPGGANVSDGLPDNLVEYLPDSLVSYEAGIHSRWFDRRLTFNAAYYRIDWSEMQIRANLPQVAFVTNAGAAKIEGVEAEFILQPVDSLTLRASGNWMRARLTRNQASGNIAAPGLKGDRIPYEPEFTAAGSAEYTTPLNEAISGVARVDVSYTGKSYTTLRPTDVFRAEQGDFTMVNAKIGVEGKEWGAYLSVENLFDTLAVYRVRSATNLNRFSFAMPPRTFRLSFNRSF